MVILLSGGVNVRRCEAERGEASVGSPADSWVSSWPPEDAKTVEAQAAPKI